MGTPKRVTVVQTPMVHPQLVKMAATMELETESKQDNKHKRKPVRGSTLKKKTHLRRISGITGISL